MFWLLQYTLGQMSMNDQIRMEVLKAYTLFSPASINVVARIEHMDQIPNLHTVCTQLVEDGLLDEHVDTEHNIRELRLTTYAQTLMHETIEQHKRSPPPATKQTIFQQLKERERHASKICTRVCAALRDAAPLQLTMLQVLDRLHQHTDVRGTTIPALHSILYMLIDTEKVHVCGPLFGMRDNTNI